MSQMKVDLIDSMGSDLTVVNAARVSMDKESDWLYEFKSSVDTDSLCIDEWKEPKGLKQADEKLISYLATHNHWTPFGHPQVTFRIKAPIFVARQLGKHQVGMVWNEVSRRYVDSDPEFFIPKELRGKATNVKQGSSDETVSYIQYEYTTWDAEEFMKEDSKLALDSYKTLLNNGVCPEQARMVLPQSMMTEWYWTGSLAAWARVYKLRIDPHSQKETQEIAKMLGEHMEKLYPVSWEALTK